MRKSNETGALVEHYQGNQLLQLDPRLATLAEIDIEVVSNIDSTDMDKQQWEGIVSKIQTNYDKYDGFLVTTGTNTLAYASSAVTFALGQIGKPVVFTGAQIPAEALATDATNNLINSLRLCIENISGVYVVFGSKIILGCRAKKISESDLDAFKTFNQSDIGTIGIGFALNKSVPPRSSIKPTFNNHFDDRVICFTLVPGMDFRCLNAVIDAGCRGIILRAYGSGDISRSLFPSLEYARSKQVPVLVTTQCPGGATVMGINSIGLEALKLNVIQVFDMSMEAMSTKLMWLLAKNVPYAEIKREMHRNYCGEVDSARIELLLQPELKKEYEKLGEIQT